MDQIRTGKFIAAMRREKALTQRQLADALGISDKTVSKWETGKGLPEVSLMLPLCEILNISVNELLSGQRLTEETYKQKAEENIMALMGERKKNQRRMLWSVMILLATFFIAFFIVLVTIKFEMPLQAHQLLIAAALMVTVLGEVFLCTVDRTTGYFQCGNCNELFVPDWKTYFKGAWSVLPWSARFTCPHCGKTGTCRRRLER